MSAGFGGLRYTPGKPASPSWAALKRAGNQSIANATNTAVAFNATHKAASWLEISGGNARLLAAGRYLVSCSITMDTAAGPYNLWVGGRSAGRTIARDGVTGAGAMYTAMGGSGILEITAAQVPYAVQVDVEQQTGGARNVLSDDGSDVVSRISFLKF